MFLWIKYRTKHSAGPSAWEWREFHFPDEADRHEYFDACYRDELHDELSTQSEHWRGIEWEFENPSTDFLSHYIKQCAGQITSTKAAILRAEALLGARQGATLVQQTRE